MPDNTLTPTEDLVMEVLAARVRLGEQIWTFNRNPSIAKAVKSLVEKGYVLSMNGVVENTIRASMTEKAEAVFLFDDYVPPILRYTEE